MKQTTARLPAPATAGDCARHPIAAIAGEARERDHASAGLATAFAGRDLPRPWAPDEPEPRGGWPAVPTAIPCVVSEWVRRVYHSGRVETRPVHSWLAHPAAAVKYDDAGVSRVHRFARAWSGLVALRLSEPATATPSTSVVEAASAVHFGLCRSCVGRLLRNGILKPMATRAKAGNVDRIAPNAD